MTKGATIRDEIIFKTLQEELLGPCPYGDELDVINLTTISADFNSPFVTKNDKEEILKVYPIQRYGVGVIYPMDLTQESLNSEIPLNSDKEEQKDAVEEDIEISNAKKFGASKQPTFDDSNEFDISLTNSRAPSSIGLSFLLNSDFTDELSFEISGAFYKDFTISLQRESKVFQDTWWYRKPIKISFNKKISELGCVVTSFRL